MSKRKSNKSLWVLGTLGIILISVGSWALFSLFYQGSTDILGWLGVQNEYAKYGLIIAVVFIGIIITGGTAYKAVNKLVKGT
jgi:flagellar basal body-associated protein FliL